MSYKTTQTSCISEISLVKSEVLQFAFLSRPVGAGFARVANQLKFGLSEKHSKFEKNLPFKFGATE